MPELDNPVVSKRLESLDVLRGFGCFAAGELRRDDVYRSGRLRRREFYGFGKPLSEWIDRVVLGRWRDGASLDENGAVVFPAWYTYTWIWSSLNFGVTVMTGVFAGQILKSRIRETKKMKRLLLIGVGMVAAGWLWHLQMPVIKRIWTSSMVLVSGGYCFLLMALFYYLTDYRRWRKGTGWLRVIGMNSIVAYLLSVE